MEGMAKGWDGSRHCTAYGHDFISVSIVGPGFADAVPAYVKIARGRKSKGDLLDGVIEAVKKVVGENGWFAVDRGMDSVEFVFFMKRRGYLGARRAHMNYGWLRRHGYLIGSGHIESACKVTCGFRRTGVGD